MVGEKPLGTTAKRRIGLVPLDFEKKTRVGGRPQIVGDRVAGYGLALGGKEGREVSERNAISATFRREGERRLERTGVAQVSAVGDVAQQNGTEYVDQIRFGVRQNRVVRRGRHAAPGEVVAPDRLFRDVGTNRLSHRPEFPERIGRDFEAHGSAGQKRRLAREGIGPGGGDKEVAAAAVLQGADDFFPGLDRPHFVEKHGESLSRPLCLFRNVVVQDFGPRETPQGRVLKVEEEKILFRKVELLRRVRGNQSEKTGLSAAAKAGQHFDEAVPAVRPNASQKVGAGMKRHGNSPTGSAWMGRQPPICRSYSTNGEKKQGLPITIDKPVGSFTTQQNKSAPFPHHGKESASIRTEPALWRGRTAS